MPFLDDIASLLTTAGLGNPGETIFVGAQPDSPDNVITLYRTGGWGVPGCPDENLEYPTFQVRVRNVEHDSGESVLSTVKTALNWQHEVSLNGVRYLLIVQMDEPRCWGVDQRLRWEWTQNFEVIKEIST